MKTIIVSVVLVALIAWVCHAQSQPAAAKHEPNSGFVSDAISATDIAKVVLSRLLTPEDLAHKQLFDATLKDGVWTVQCTELKIRLSSPIVIKIRQKTGGIISY